MKSAVKSNGTIANLIKYQPLFIKTNEPFAAPKLTVQQALAKWYTILNKKGENLLTESSIFPTQLEDDLCNSLKTDVELIPALLMEEFISSNIMFEKEQYIRLVQALLINISDEVFVKMSNDTIICACIENTLSFLQNFFYQYFDINSRITKFRYKQFADCSLLKLNYLHLKLDNSRLIQIFQQASIEQTSLQEVPVSFHHLLYFKNIIKEIETGLTAFTENAVRELLYFHNFNSPCFIEHEIDFLKDEIENIPLYADKVSFLQNKFVSNNQVKSKSLASFDNKQPTIKKQIADWIIAEIKHIELVERKASNTDLQIAAESKIQTTLSVAKLAVLIRVMVVDKIIINQPIAPALRTVSKLFTTLQKDEISYGSLETKYHAPDKNTINMMKEMLQKWVVIVGKL